jgi:hypothetical protein
MRINKLLKMLCFVALFASFGCQKAEENNFITVRQNGEMTLFGEAVGDLETLKMILTDSLANMATIPTEIPINFEGEVGMGLRQEVESIVAEALETAKKSQNLPRIEMQTFREEQGKDCDKADEMEKTDCARIDFLYPTVKKGTQALKDSVSAWSVGYLNSILAMSAEDVPNSLEDAAKVFFAAQKEYKNSAMGGGFEANTGSEVLLNNGEYLTLAISGSTYQGGAHGAQFQALNTFDAQTGKILTWDDLITNKAALQKLAEAKVRTEKADVFKAGGFDFDETFLFVLPANYALTEDGLYLIYVPYEIMPYAMGSTEIMISFEELGELAKIKL